MTTDDMEIVSALKLALAERVGQERFELWFGAATRLEHCGGALTVYVASRFHQDWLRNHFRHDIESACRATLGGLVPVQFQIDRELAQHQTTACQPAGAQQQSTAQQTAAPRGAVQQLTAQHFAAGQQNASGHQATAQQAYLFVSGTPAPRSNSVVAPAIVGESRRRLAALDTFVVGDSNRLAWSAARSIVSRPSHLSPLVLYGPTSVGKTHLLEGICHEARQARSGAQAVYLPAEQFTTMFLDALHGGGLPVFRRKYRSLDLLIIDDIQFLARKRATLTELQHMIDVFLREGRRLVFAADRPPSELGELGQEFVTRLQGGLSCGIELPEYETRLGIVRRLAELRSLDLPAEIEQFIAEKVATHARELSGALNRLDATSRALDEPITLELVEQALAETVRRHARSVGLGDIDQAVCELFGLQPQALQSQAKAKQVSHPRMLAMWLARRYTRAALSEIGGFFGGRAHSTVISAEKKVRHWMESQEPLRLADGNCSIDEAIRRIELKLRAG
ncbi:MAG TPA: chromosomal replication initiator protein DnaA [Pirellulales bacterium]|nr:chromosomal replication initiator protein DnaA [Pirellulales bacterium]